MDNRRVVDLQVEPRESSRTDGWLWAEVVGATQPAQVPAPNGAGRPGWAGRSARGSPVAPVLRVAQRGRPWPRVAQ
jgi:hypothetical protein